MRIKLLLITAISVSLLVTPLRISASTKTLTEKATGRYYNDFLKQFQEHEIVVFVDHTGRIAIKDDDAIIGPVRGSIRKGKLNCFIDLLKKSGKWAATAKDEKIEITKELKRTVTQVVENPDAPNGVPKKRSKTFDPVSCSGGTYIDSKYSFDISLRFFSSSNGTQTDVIMKIEDFENEFRTTTLYLDTAQVKRLISVLEKAPQAIKELKALEKQTDKFQ